MYTQNLCTQNIHTYIHNWPLQPFSQDYGLTKYTHTKYTLTLKKIFHLSACGCVHHDDIEANEILLVNQNWRRSNKYSSNEIIKLF